MPIASDIHGSTAEGDARAEKDAATPPASPTTNNRIESHALAATNSASARHALIAEAAYHRARLRGFAAGDEWRDWFAAEREVDGLLDPDP